MSLHRVDSLLYREMVEEDWDGVVELVTKVWFEELEQIPSAEVKKLTATVDTHHLFPWVTFGIVAIDEIEGKIVGVVAVRGPDDLDKQRQEQHAAIVEEAIAQGRTFGSDVHEQLCAYKDEATRHWKLVYEKRPRTYDGEVVLIILDPDYQGCGIGRKLLNQGLAWCKSQGSTLVCLDTDDTCNYQFYDHLGWRRALEYPYSFEIFGVVYNSTEYIYEWEIEHVPG